MDAEFEKLNRLKNSYDAAVKNWNFSKRDQIQAEVEESYQYTKQFVQAVESWDFSKRDELLIKMRDFGLDKTPQPCARKNHALNNLVLSNAVLDRNGEKEDPRWLQMAPSVAA